jgi:hypothetical protein
MYDDYDLDYTYTNDHTYDLDEYTLDENTYHEYHTQLDADLDDEYARDSHDYDALAYRHYA